MFYLDTLGFGSKGWGPALLEGALMTLLVSLAALAVGAALGSLVAWARLSGSLIAGAVGEGYAALFRGLPELLVIYFVYFGSSGLLTGLGHALGFEGFLGRSTASAGGGAARGRDHFRGVPSRGVPRRVSRHRARGTLEAARAVSA